MSQIGDPFSPLEDKPAKEKPAKKPAKKAAAADANGHDVAAVATAKPEKSEKPAKPVKAAKPKTEKVTVQVAAKPAKKAVAKKAAKPAKKAVAKKAAKPKRAKKAVAKKAAKPKRAKKPAKNPAKAKRTASANGAVRVRGIYLETRGGKPTKNVIFIRKMEQKGGATFAELKKSVGWKDQAVRSMISILATEKKLPVKRLESDGVTRYYMPPEK